ncbi:hypothetical protein [Nocardia ignorata]|uniref:Replication region DNA-binding N-term n=1 Tax=Nocardia ignorata TaxID=145285 RepID=A0A4R6NXI4_NOCIG|nr:hypothetical protein [Nocardia ignorata]TDP28650.1 hypothetical protein DFR75_11648 [Nocardia ignorata]
MSAPRTPAQVLQEARKRSSLEKRGRVLAVVNDMVARDEPITFLGVARAAEVSNWLVYAGGVREHIEKARAHQQARPRHERAAGRGATPAGVRTDLALAHAEITRLRSERDQLKATVQRQLGQQLDQLGAADLITRVDELTAHNKMLIEQLKAAQDSNVSLQQQLTEADDDLAAARISLRKMIREENQHRHLPPSESWL